MSEWTVPDSIEEVVGYRAWNVTRDDELRATGSSDFGTWIPGENVARCYANPEAHLRTYRVNGLDGLETVTEDTHGLIPAEDCKCGFWLLKGLDYVIDKFLHSGSLSFAMTYALLASRLAGEPDEEQRVIFGQVKAWGRVVAGAKGYRAERVQIVELYDGKHPNLVDSDKGEAIATKYGVPLVREKHLDAPPKQKPPTPEHYDFGYRRPSSYHGARSGYLTSAIQTYNEADAAFERMDAALRKPPPAKWKKFLGTLGITT